MREKKLALCDGVHKPRSFRATVLFVNYTEQDNHDRDYQQNVNESSHRVRADQSQQPEDEHDNGNGIKHVIAPPVKAAVTPSIFDGVTAVCYFFIS